MCAKCLRTQLTLDLLDKLQLYDRVFDNDKYLTMKNSAIVNVLGRRRRDKFSAEIFSLMKEKKYKLSFGLWVKAHILMGIDWLRKGIKALLRQ